MRKQIAVLAVLLAAGLAASAPAAATTDIYMYIASIPGEATARNFQHYIQLLSYSQSVQAPAVTSGAGLSAGKASCGQITLTKHLDKASPLLIRAVISGMPIKQAVISFVDTQGNGGAQEVDYIVTLTDVVFTSVQQSDPSPSEFTENVTLVAKSFMIDYVPFGANGRAGTPEKISVNCEAAVAS